MFIQFVEATFSFAEKRWLFFYYDCPVTRGNVQLTSIFVEQKV